MIATKLRHTSIVFGNYYDLLDACMLFGAQLDRGKGNFRGHFQGDRRRGQSRLSRLTISRSRAYWPSLYWLISLLSSHGIELRTRGLNTVKQGRVVFSTRYDPFLVAAHDRWYSEAGLRVPNDIQLTEQMAAVWLVDAFSRWRVCRPLTLVAPPSIMTTGDEMQYQFESITGMPTELVKPSRSTRLVVEPDKISDLRDWIEGRVPRSVWDK